jgi:hypothetical protein
MGSMPVFALSDLSPIKNGRITGVRDSELDLVVELERVKKELARVTEEPMLWSTPIGWSSLNVSASSASGLSPSCFLARADGSARRYAV